MNPPFDLRVPFRASLFQLRAECFQRVVNVENVFCEFLTCPLAANQYLVREEPNRIGNAYLFRTAYGIPVVLADFNCPGVIKQHFQMTQLLRHDPGDSFSRFWLSVTS